MKEVIRVMLSNDRLVFLKTNTKKEVIQELVEVLTNSPYIEDREELLSSLLEREEIMSTGIGFGIAVPHVKIKTVSDIAIAIGLHKEGIEWGTLLDSETVKIVVMIVAPEFKTKEYLRLLAKVVKILKKKEVREQIINSENLEDVKKFFQ